MIAELPHSHRAGTGARGPHRTCDERGRWNLAEVPHVQAGMPPLAAVAALIGIDLDDPADADDLAVLRDLLARRVALVEQGGDRDGQAPDRPGLRVVRDQ